MVELRYLAMKGSGLVSFLYPENQAQWWMQDFSKGDSVISSTKILEAIPIFD